jgi:hypothetical protein
VTANIRERINKESEVLKEVLKSRKVLYAIVFAVPVVGFAASALWIARDYFWHKKNGENKETV